MLRDREQSAALNTQLTQGSLQEKIAEMKRNRTEPSSGGKESGTVLVMGSLFVELVPEPQGQCLVHMERLVPTAAGAAANFARALAALGMRVGMLSRVGEDELGQWLRRQLEERGIEAGAVLSAPGELTPVSFAWADQQGGKVFVFYRFPGYCDPLGTFSPTDLPQGVISQARAFDFTEAVVRTPRVRAVAFAAAECARQAGVPVAYAVNYRPQLWAVAEKEMRAVQREAIARADVTLMNEEEYGLIFPPGEKWQARENQILVVTAGEKGGWVETERWREWFRAFPVEVQYDVGAGDSFHAGFLAAYLQGEAPLRAARFGAACAALKISRPASSPPPTRAEIEAFMNGYL